MKANTLLTGTIACFVSVATAQQYSAGDILLSCGKALSNCNAAADANHASCVASYFSCLAPDDRCGCPTQSQGCLTNPPTGSILDCGPAVANCYANCTTGPSTSTTSAVDTTNMTTATMSVITTSSFSKPLPLPINPTHSPTTPTLYLNHTPPYLCHLPCPSISNDHIY